MKTTLVLPLLSSLLLVGCSRTATQKTTSANLNADTSRSTVAATSTTTTPKAPPVDNSPPPTVSVTVPPPKTESAEASESVESIETTPAASKDGVATAPSDIVNPVTASGETPAAAEAATDESTIASHIAEWKLTPQDITQDIKNSDRIERSREASEAGAPTGLLESRTVSDVVAAKLRSDSDIGPLKLGVIVAKDTATLTGSAQSVEQIGRAMALALDTQGVAKVVSRIKLETPVPASPKP